MEYLNAPLEIKSIDNKGSIKGYASVFNNIDLGNDIIKANAFTKVKTTRDGKLRLALHHDLRYLVGKATYKQDAKGLYIDGQLNMDVSYARDAYPLIKDGTLDGMSIGYGIIEQEYETRNKKQIRIIKEAELFEASIVAFGMNPKAKVQSVKAANNIHTSEEFERFLIGAGFSIDESKAISLHGYIDPDRKSKLEAEQENEILNHIKQFTNNLKTKRFN